MVQRYVSRVWSAVLVACVVALGAGPAHAAAGDAALLSPMDEAAYRSAFTLAKVQQWSKAFEATARSNDPLAAKVLTWAYVADPASGAPFAKIAEFLEANPAWQIGRAHV
mgnify:FL=1